MRLRVNWCGVNYMGGTCVQEPPEFTELKPSQQSFWLVSMFLQAPEVQQRVLEMRRGAERFDYIIATLEDATKRMLAQRALQGVFSTSGGAGEADADTDDDGGVLLRGEAAGGDADAAGAKSDAAQGSDGEGAGGDAQASGSEASGSAGGDAAGASGDEGGGSDAARSDGESDSPGASSTKV